MVLSRETMGGTQKVAEQTWNLEEDNSCLNIYFREFVIVAVFNISLERVEYVVTCSDQGTTLQTEGSLAIM